MNNIKKLAIEQMIYEHTKFNPNVADDAETIKHIKNLLESFAKALQQQSEPTLKKKCEYCSCVISMFSSAICNRGTKGCNEKHPPATVPLEKYNKLLDALKSIRGDTSDLHSDETTQQLINRLLLVRQMADFTIAEAEGKEGWIN